MSCDPGAIKFNFVYVGFFLYGIGGLMPWNFFITPANYWHAKLEFNTSLAANNVTHVDVNWMQNFWENFLSLFCTGIVFVMSIVMHFRPHSWTKEGMVSMSLTVSCVLFVVTAIIGLFNNSEWKVAFFWLNLILATLLCAFCAILQNIGMVMTSGLGARYVQAICSGQGLAGVLSAIAYCINLSVAGDPFMAGVTFFITAAVFAGLTLINHLLVTRSHFYAANADNHDAGTDTDPLIKNEIVEHISEKPHDADDEITNWFIIKRCYPEIYAVFTTLLVTLSLFPGLCAAVKSNSDDEFTKTWFSPVLTMLLYNVGDTMGRLSTSLVAIKPSRKKTIMILSSCRVIFWLLFPICNIDRIGGNVQTLITEDWIYALLMLLFSFSNGWITTICYANAPQRFNDNELVAREKAEELIFTGLSSGLITGSLLSFAVKAIAIYA